MCMSVYVCVYVWVCVQVFSAHTYLHEISMCLEIANVLYDNKKEWKNKWKQFSQLWSVICCNSP